MKRRYIFLGDSLMQVNGPDTFPQTGWPTALSPYLKEGIEVLDFAKNGRSTKSFKDEGWLDLALKEAKEGDLLFLGFGHNDEKEDPARHSEPYGSYLENIQGYIDAFGEKGVKLGALFTPITRLKYNESGELYRTHGDYPRALREFASKKGYPLIDLEEITFEALKGKTFDENKSYYMCLAPGEYENYPDGQSDTTHLSLNGAKWICSLVRLEAKKIPELAKDFA